MSGAPAPRSWVRAVVVVVLGASIGVAVAVATVHEAPQPGNAASGAQPAPPLESAIPEISAASVPPAEPDELPSSGFNTERYSLDDAESPWVVVNKQRPLEPRNYAPDDLVSASGVSFTDGGTMRSEAADALADMQSAARAQGLSFRVSSAYRAYARQAEIYDEYERDWGTARADKFSARAGYSEHQTGWSADLYDSPACRLKVCFGESAVGRWVAEHGAEYGYIVRYSDGDSDVTGYMYEPWHVRYVGVDLATEMRERGIATLEEFFGLPAAPQY